MKLPGLVITLGCKVATVELCHRPNGGLLASSNAETVSAVHNGPVGMALRQRRARVSPALVLQVTPPVQACPLSQAP